MTFDVGAFRTDFPEFADTVKYPSQTIQVWAALAMVQLNQQLFGTQWVLMTQLFVAHELVMAAANEKTAEAGGSPGTFGGVANSKTVGSASVAYDSNATSEDKAGWWNLTNYGKQLYRFIRIYGAGCIQL